MDTCDIAAELERQRALKIVADVQALRIGGADNPSPTEFQAGYLTACEEIEYRLQHEVWELSLTPNASNQGQP